MENCKVHLKPTCNIVVRVKQSFKCNEQCHGFSILNALGRVQKSDLVNFCTYGIRWTSKTRWLLEINILRAENEINLIQICQFSRLKIKFN